jgi:hypothetical protein
MANFGDLDFADENIKYGVIDGAEDDGDNDFQFVLSYET